MSQNVVLLESLDSPPGEPLRNTARRSPKLRTWTVEGFVRGAVIMLGRKRAVGGRLCVALVGPHIRAFNTIWNTSSAPYVYHWIHTFRILLEVQWENKPRPIVREQDSHAMEMLWADHAWMYTYELSHRRAPLA